MGKMNEALSTMILITRLPDKSVELMDELLELGYTAEYASVIATRSLPPSSTTLNLLSKAASGSFDGIAFTSSEAVKYYTKLANGTLPRTPVFAQAKATADAVKRNLNLAAKVPPSDFTSEALADFIVSKLKPDSKVLFCAATRTSGGFLTRAKELGLDVTHCELYETFPTIYDEKAIAVLHQAHQSPIYLVYSPSAVESIIESYKSFPSELASCRFLTIGPKTSKAVRAAGLEVLGEAKEPSDKAMKDLVTQCFPTSF